MLKRKAFDLEEPITKLIMVGHSNSGQHKNLLNRIPRLNRKVILKDEYNAAISIAQKSHNQSNIQPQASYRNRVNFDDTRMPPSLSLAILLS